jgi:hypothetical protein
MEHQGRNPFHGGVGELLPEDLEGCYDSRRDFSYHVQAALHALAHPGGNVASGRVTLFEEQVA